MIFIVNRVCKHPSFFTLESKTSSSPAMSDKPEGEAPQKRPPNVAVIAYFIGTEVHRGKQGNVFLKHNSNRGTFLFGDRSPSGPDTQASFCCTESPAQGAKPLVQGAPYLFNSSLVLDIDFPHHFSILSPLKDIKISNMGVNHLPFLQGQVSPCLSDPKFVLFFNPTSPLDVNSVNTPLSKFTLTNLTSTSNIFYFNSPLPLTKVVLSSLPSYLPLLPSLSPV